MGEIRNTPRPGKKYLVVEKFGTNDISKSAIAQAFEVGNIISFVKPSPCSPNLDIVIHWGTHSLKLVERPRAEIYSMFAVGRDQWTGKDDGTLYRIVAQ